MARLNDGVLLSWHCQEIKYSQSVMYSSINLWCIIILVLSGIKVVSVSYIARIIFGVLLSWHCQEIKWSQSVMYSSINLWCIFIVVLSGIKVVSVCDVWLD
jgi:hypothetical protein